jgi:hypothetical protein
MDLSQNAPAIRFGRLRRSLHYQYVLRRHQKSRHTFQYLKEFGHLAREEK